MSRESAVKSFPALTVPPSLRTHGRNGNASRLRVGPLRPRRGPKGIRPRGGGQIWEGNGPLGALPRCSFNPKAESPGRSRLAALESGFSSFRAEMASMFASLQGRLTGVSALSGVSALPGVSALQGLSGVSAFSGLSALPGQSIHSATVHGDTPMEVEMWSALAGPPRLPLHSLKWSHHSLHTDPRCATK